MGKNKDNLKYHAYIVLYINLPFNDHKYKTGFIYAIK